MPLEAAVLLVAAAVLILLFVRAEGQAFHVPGGDGGVITAAGFWTCVLIVWRIFDKEGTSRHGQIAYTSGIEWGIFVALGVAAVLTYAGSQIRLAHEPEPPLPGSRSRRGAGGRKRRRGWLRKGSDDAHRRGAAARAAYPGPDMGADDDWTQEVRARARRAAAALRGAHPRRASAARPPVTTPPTRRTPHDASEAPTARADASEAPTQRSRPRSLREAPIPAGRSRRAGPGRLTAARSRSSTSPSRRPRGWAARRRPRRTAPRSRGHAGSARPPSPTRRRPRPSGSARVTGRADPNDDQLTIRLDRPN